MKLVLHRRGGGEVIALWIASFSLVKYFRKGEGPPFADPVISVVLLLLLHQLFSGGILYCLHARPVM